MIELETVCAALRTISATLDGELATARALEALRELIGCERARVVRLEAGELRVQAIEGEGAPSLVEVGAGDDAAGEEPKAEPGELIVAGRRLRIDLVDEGRALGRIELELAAAEHAAAIASDERARVLRAMAEQLAVALVNAELHADLRASEARVWSILDNTRSVVFIKDLDGRYVLVNRQLMANTGLEREQLIGWTDRELFPTAIAERILADDRQVLDTGEMAEFEGVTQFPTGLRVFLTTKFPVRDRAGRIFGLCGISTDITERKRAQRLEHLDVIGRLASGIAHDLNNVLMGIVASTELLGATAPAPRDPEFDAELQTILDATDRAADLASKLMLFSRESHRPRQRVDLHELITALVTLLGSSDRRLEIRLELHASSAAVHGDAARLQAALLQLGVNAIDAIDDSQPELAILTRDVELESGPQLEIELRDTGIGIPADVLPHIFDPLYTTKKIGAGRGLGLAAVHGTIVAHGGTIAVRSELGVGTSFVIRLPKLGADARRSDARRRTASGSRMAEAKSGAKTALLVDDEDAIRRTVKRMLERLGYRVFVAEDGEQGVDRFSAHHEELSLVLLDMVMPKLGGAEAFRRMHAIDSRIPIIVCSGYAPGEEVRGLERLGLAGFLAKPYRLAELEGALAKLSG